jgi:hypothetical protein
MAGLAGVALESPPHSTAERPEDALLPEDGDAMPHIIAVTPVELGPLFICAS